MTRKEALELLDTSTIYDSFDNCCVVEHNYEEIINEIFNEHEAQLKAKNEAIEELHSRLETIDADYSAIARDFESAVMEIERLKEAMQEFVNRCEKGEVRSKYTYSKFKELLKETK